ncbi:MAG: flippase-like domain-containing protein, partial [Dehalococcoidia bacterium]|nr:flippase-like domain-containing protein [Dehalococcoidia bacterium]
MPASLTSRLAVFIGLTCAVGAGLVIYADLDAFREALSDFKWWVVPPILALVAANYSLRFIRWHYYLGIIGASKALPLSTSLLIFLSGLAMVITPAKAGEWIKSYLLREMNGTPIARSTPVVFAERLTDGWSIALLAVIGLLLFRPSYWPFFAVFAGLQLIFLAVIYTRPLARAIIRRLDDLPVVSRWAVHAEALYDSSYALLRPRPIAAALVLGFIGWGCEAAGLYLVIYGLTDQSSLEVLVKSAFIMSVSSLVGAFFIVPGGLGVAETGITGLGRALLDLSRGSAAAATILIRFFTLWFGVAVGLLALALVTRAWQGPSPTGSILSSRRIETTRPQRRTSSCSPVVAGL